MGTWMRRVGWAVAAVAVVAGIAWLLQPEPLTLDVAQVQRGPMQVTLDERGELRSRDHFSIAAPVSGRLMRMELRDGDRVEEGQVLARIAPLPLGARERDERTARLAAAEAVQREAAQRAQRARAELEQARRERERADRLVAQGFLSPQAAEQARTAESAAALEAEAARFRERAAEADVRMARAALLDAGAAGTPGTGMRSQGGALVAVHAPMAGRVLRVPDRSERVVAAGAPLMTLADTTRLEAVIEMLSTEAVRVRPGMPVLLEGGGAPLRATVRLVEPFAFTKLSALGIEEKRTHVIADLAEPADALGDGYRVEAKVVVWRTDDTLRLPASAAFRCGEGWCAFAVEAGHARRRTLELGQRNALEVQVLGGLAEGDTVVRHPGNDLEDGARVAPR